MTLRELADPRFYASLIADFDLGRAGVRGHAPMGEHASAAELNDDFEETRPCSWYVTVTDDPPSARS